MNKGREDISRIIINVLALNGPQNINDLTREVQRERGKGSYSATRKKVLELLDEGLIEGLIEEG